MDLTIKPAGPLIGTISVPGDKSISHRAVMLGALAEGDTQIENFLAGADCLATVDCFRKLGIEIDGPAGGVLTVRGRGLDGLREPVEVLDAANSGTTMRLLSGVLAGQPFFSVITGDASLRRRPMARVTGPLKQMGACIMGRRNDSLAPLAIRGGGLKALDFVSPVASAQVKSAVLLAGLFADGETVVTEPYRSRNHTELMLEHFGARVQVSASSVRLKGGPVLKGRRVVVPGDISSAAFFLVAAAMVPGSDITVAGVGVNPTRSGMLAVLQEMGADLQLLNQRELNGERVADIRVRFSRLKGVTVAGELIPALIDEVPVLAVAAAAAEGITEIRDAAELKVKESNRIATVVEELRKLGADLEELPDGLKIRGGRSLKGAVCKSHGDHRIAMALVVAGLVAAGETCVRDAGCIDISFPGFADVLKLLRER